ncbi:uncharacterized protein LOC132705912 isoform X2 [Cylas formicarius]|uniref:uncharacterized protein LOC132705912 isoform X2 n=1 Tax=Cylas formicarius TaxID=197179 RepID=UPI0029583D42|nr:uncharacterized protein LOC132705912 isoform X2 [Cylas formicarius]
MINLRFTEECERHPAKRIKVDDHGSSVEPKSNVGQPLTLKRCDSASNGIKRIFPGPAGVISDDFGRANDPMLCSQQTARIFEDGPWKDMSKDFYISDNVYLFNKFNISWIKKQAGMNKFLDQKAPYLAGILQSLEVSETQLRKSVNITLKDLTGQIQGMIQQSLYEDYCNFFTLGAVLVLTQFGVLSCNCNKCDNHHLTITSNSLSAIYNGKQKLVLKKIDPQELCASFYKNVNEQMKIDSKKISAKCSTSAAISSSCRQMNMCNVQINSEAKKFHFKKTPKTLEASLLIETLSPENSKKKDLNSIPVPNSQISLKVDRSEHKKIWDGILEDVDLSALFEDF